MILRIGNVLLVLVAIAFVVGDTAVILSGPVDWADLANAVVYLLLGQWEILLGILALAVVLAVTITFVVARSVVSARRRRKGLIVPMGVAEGQSDEHRLLRRARRALDLEISRARPEVERVIDVLFGVPVDVGATHLYMQPGPLAVDISLVIQERHHLVTSMPAALYPHVLHNLRLMIGARKTGEGTVDLHSSRRAEQVEIKMRQGKDGIWTTLEVIDAGEAAQEQDPPRRRRASSVVFRIEPTPIENVHSGELPLHLIAGTDRGDPSGETEIAPLMPPPQGRTVLALESWLRLALGATLMLLVLCAFWNAYGWGYTRLVSGRSPAPWREVTLHVVATPVEGEVTIQGRREGRTPLSFTEPCRGRAITVLVKADGYTTWQWNGICERARLHLKAHLTPLHKTP